MSTFVYNSGSFEPKREGELNVTFGLFFDGTKNNRYHTEIRKKIEDKGEFKGQAPSDKDRDIYEKYGDNESFGNDFTNVARQWYCCERNEYAIYVEGIGTVGKDVKDKSDHLGGFAYGRGVTGIIAKVKAGCKELAERIAEKKDNEEDDNEEKKITKLKLTIDAFGFSRGAAAARHFLHNLQMKAYEPEWYYPSSYNGYDHRSRYKVDYAEDPINDSWLKEEKLPRCGFLGTSLLQVGITRELIDTMDIDVRFLGIYDTVASYDPECLFIPNFEKQIDKLHLHDLGNPTRAVHYTAADEHRENFALTPLKIGDEFILPGVHSDVGGSYDHDKISKEQFTQKRKNAKLKLQKEPTLKASEYEMVHLSNNKIFKNFDTLRRQLIQEGWFYPDEIEVKYVPVFFYGIRVNIIKYLYAERILNRGFSFIPLQFMCDEAAPLLGKVLFTERLFTNYALEDKFLEKVKSYIQEQIIEKVKSEKNAEKKKNIKWELKDPERMPYQQEDMLSTTYSVSYQEPDDFSKTNEPVFELEEVEVTAYQSDYMLRKLRNRYLHWSAKLNTITDTLAHAPAKNRIRRDF